MRGKRACGFSDWRVRACHNPKRLLRVFIHAKGGTFSTFERPLAFPVCYGGRGFWTFVMSFACYMYNFNFCECLTSKNDLEI